MDIYISTKTQDGDLIDNFVTSTTLIEELRDVMFLELGVGCYNGEQELSLRLLDMSPTSVDRMLTVAERYNQESILVVSDRNIATLHYTNGKTETIGEFKEVKGKPDGDFSYFGKTYYTVV